MGKVLISLTTFALATLGISGCSSDSRMTAGNGAPMVQTIPAERASAYDPAAPIYLKFSEAVDTGKFHDSFFCMEDSSHKALHDSLSGGMMGDGTSYGDMGDHGSMGGMMQGMMGDSSQESCARMHSSMMGNGMMGGNHRGASDSTFYDRMHGRRVPGQLSWNASGDSCVFTPAAGLMPNQDYVMMFRSDMRTRSGGRMRHQGGLLSQDMMIHFRTR